MDIDKVVKSKTSLFRSVVTIVAILYIVFAIWIGFVNSPLFSAISFTMPVILWLLAKWFGKKITYEWCEQQVEKHTRENQNSLRRYSDAAVRALELEQSELLQRKESLENEEDNVSTQLKTEREKVDSLSVDISLISKVPL